MPEWDVNPVWTGLFFLSSKFLYLGSSGGGTLAWELGEGRSHMDIVLACSMHSESPAGAHHVSVTLMGRWEGGRAHPEFSIKSCYNEALRCPGTDEILLLLK